MVGENGNMNISIEEVEKLSVLYTLKKVVILGGITTEPLKPVP